MKISITEKQLKLVLGNAKKFINEEDPMAASSTPATVSPDGITPSTTDTTGYPEVGKWESGVTRGSSNQIGNTKWSDTVGSKLTRGKANQLK